MKCLITGHLGFIGRRLLAELNGRGHEASGLETEGGELIDLLDAAAVEARVRKLRPKVIYHLGGVSGSTVLADRPDLVLRINGEGTLTMLRSASRAGVGRFVFASSIAAFARGSAAGPGIVYGMSKRLGEMLVSGDTSAFERTSVRIGSVFGSGRQTYSEFHEMAKSALREGTFPYWNTVFQPSIEVGDCARQLAGLADSASLATTYDAVSDTPDGETVAACIAELTGARALLQGQRAAPQYEIGFDGAPLVEDSGAGPAMTLRAALADLVEAFRIEEGQ